MKLIPAIYNDNINSIQNFDVKLLILSYFNSSEKRKMGYINKEWMTVVEEAYRRNKRTERLIHKRLCGSETKYFIKCLGGLHMTSQKDLKYPYGFIDNSVRIQKYKINTAVSKFISVCRENQCKSYFTIDKVKEAYGHIYKSSSVYTTENTILMYSETFDDIKILDVIFPSPRERIETHYDKTDQDDFIIKSYKNDILKSLKYGQVSTINK